MKVKKYLLVFVVLIVLSLAATSVSADWDPPIGHVDHGKGTISIPAGDDQFKVVDAGFDIQLPADFFGPGSDPFEGTIVFCGGDDSSVDTTIKRLDDIILPPPPSEDTIPIEIIELNLVSCQPITVNTNDGSQQQWSVNVGLSPIAPLPGQMTIKRTHENGGTFDSELPVQPRFTFTQVGEGETTEPGTIVGDSPLGHGSDFITEPQPVIWEIEFNKAFVFRAHSVSWVECVLEPTVFCPGPVALSDVDGSWLNLELVFPAPDSDTDDDCDGVVDEDCGGTERGEVCGGIDDDCDAVYDCRDDSTNDVDNDDVCDATDNCPSIANPDQSDLDTDGLGDACDGCIFDPNNDADNDGICGDVDSCPNENPQGLDADSDGCTDTIEGLYDNLQNTEIQAGVKNSLLAKVNSALSSFTGEKINAAINQLNAFINQVEAQSGKKISQEDATVLTGFAQNIIRINDGDSSERMPRAVAYCSGICALEDDPHDIEKWRSAAATAYSWGECGGCTSEERDAQLKNAKEICVAKMELQCGRMGPRDYILVENQNQFGGSYTFCADCECEAE